MMAKPLERFWNDEAKRELDILLPKAREYGASDLRIMGYALRDWLGLDKFSTRDGEEMAIAFYVLGKVARLFSAYQDGRLPSRDTWEDLAIYARMAIRVREAQSWPGPLDEESTKATSEPAARPAPAKASAPVKKAPAKASTPAKAASAKKVPAKASAPAKKAPAKASAPAKAAPKPETPTPEAPKPASTSNGALAAPAPSSTAPGSPPLFTPFAQS